MSLNRLANVVFIVATVALCAAIFVGKPEPTESVKPAREDIVAEDHFCGTFLPLGLAGESFCS